MDAKIKTIICPNCDGVGKDPEIKETCSDCQGKGVLENVIVKEVKQ